MKFDLLEARWVIGRPGAVKTNISVVWIILSNWSVRQQWAFFKIIIIDSWCSLFSKKNIQKEENLW